MITVTISGFPGSGKTTAGKLLAEKLGLKYVYSGQIFRESAEKHNMSLEEFGSYCEKHEEIDKQLDDYQLEIIRKGNVIVEGRIAGWLAYFNKIDAIKVWLNADIITRVKRIISREKGDFEKKKQEILVREKSEAVRYKKYYNIEVNDTSIYDIIIDTSKKTPEEIINIIAEEIRG